MPDYAALAPLVQQTCREFGLRYTANPTFRAGVASHFRWLRRMGRPATARYPESHDEESDLLIQYQSGEGLAQGRESRVNYTRVLRLRKRKEACDEIP